MFISLLFKAYCDYLDGKLKWSDTKAKEWTETIFQFFSTENAKQVPLPYIEIREHMNIDYIWRYDSTRYSTNDIELAVEHEGIETRVEVLVEEEIQHLVDLRARNKLAILYPSSGDEATLLERIRKKIQFVSEQYRLAENYFILLGYATTKNGKRAILWKALSLDKSGNTVEQRERVVMQKS